MTEQIVLLIIKIKNKLEYLQSKAIYSYRVEKAVDLVTKWADSGEISSVIKFISSKRRKEFIEVDDWIYEPRIIGVKKLQVFFKVQIIRILQRVQSRSYYKSYMPRVC